MMNMRLSPRQVALVAWICASAGAVPASAQSIIQGPDLTQRTPGEYVIRVKLDAAAPLVLTFWKSAAESEETGLTRNFTSAAEHTFRLPSGEGYSYRLALNGTKSQVFSTPSDSAIILPSATISNVKIENGNRLSFEVDGMFVNSAQISATSAGNQGVVGPVTEALRNGRNLIARDLPCTTNRTVPIQLTVSVTGLRGEVARSVTPQAITCPPEGPNRVRFNAVAVTPERRAVRIATTFSDAPETVFYKATLRFGRFSTEEASTCRKDDCRITIPNLTPGTSYTYALAAAPSATGPWQSYDPGVSGETVATLTLPTVRTAPMITFTGDRNAATATLSFQTDKPSQLELVFKDETSGLDLTTSRTPATSNHSVTLPGGIQFFKAQDRIYQSSFKIVIYDGADGSKVGELPVTVVGTFAEQRDRGVLRQNTAQVTEFIRAYGPQIVDVFKTAVVPALVTAL